MWRSIGELAGTTMLRLWTNEHLLRMEQDGIDQQPDPTKGKDMAIGQGTVTPHANCPTQIVP